MTKVSGVVRPGYGFRWGVLVFAVLFFLVVAPQASARSYHIDRFNDVIIVQEDGTLLVSEQITFVFNGSFQGVYRQIPIEYPGPHTSNYTLFIDDIKVTDDSGSPLRFESRIKGDYRNLKIFVPGASDATRTVKIDYVVRNGMRFFEDHDELYWNVTGNDWVVDIDQASAFVQFPNNAAGSLRAQAFTGFFGSTSQDASADVNGNQVRFETKLGLQPRSGMTINAYLPKGIVKQPSMLLRSFRFLESNLILLLPIFSFLVMGTLWYYKGRDPDPGMSVAPMYEPPFGMTPAEVGTLIDDRIDPQDITSTLVDLAVRGYLKIEEKNEKVLFFNSRDFIIHQVKEPSEWNTLAAHEREILENLFMTGSKECHLSELKNRFYIAIPSIRREIMDSLKSKVMYRVDPDTANGYRVVGILVIVAPVLIAQITGRYQFFRSSLMAAVAIALSVIVVWIFGRNMTAKTLKGMRAVVAIQGFREFMSRVDGDRLRKFPPDTFEKCLPFAMALGVEKHWAHSFEGIIQNPPSWYVGGNYPGNVWSPIYFTNNMSTMSNSAYEAFVSAPRASSSGSGFGGGGFSSGGGFSGGGFGGGGGGAF